MITIIGAGVAGLTCAKHLKDRGIEALVLEASDAVGGRVRTDRVEGFLLDRGFQVFLTSYPEARKILDYERLKLQILPSGARVRSGGEFFTMPNPLKDFSKAPQALFSPVGGFFDKFNILRLNFATAGAGEPDEVAAAADSETTLAFLKDYGYSDQIIERFFVPFFRGVFLERDLRTRAGFFKFLYKHFAAGDVAVPEKGMQAIPEQIAAHLAPGQIRLDAPVRGIENTTVYLENGERIEAEKIIIATDARRAARLLGEKEAPIRFNSTACLYFAADAEIKIDDEPYLMINANKGELIDHVFVASKAAASYAPAGKTLVSVNVVGSEKISAGGLEEKALAELSGWFGGRTDWRHLKTYRIEDALPEYFPDSPAGFDLKLSEKLFRCGDYAAYPSLNAAMKTGREVAEILG